MQTYMSAREHFTAQFRTIWYNKINELIQCTRSNKKRFDISVGGKFVFKVKKNTTRFKN